MTRPAENGGENQSNLGNTGGPRGVMQRAAENMSPVARMLRQSGMQAVRQVAAEPVAVTRLAGVIQPFAGGERMAAALGVSNLLQNNPNWAESVRVGAPVAALLSGIQWDLANGVNGTRKTPAPHVVPAPTQRFAATATTRAAKVRTVAEFGDALQALREEASMSLTDLAAYGKEVNRGGANIDGLSKTALSSACQGHRLFRRDVQVTHFVTACRAAADVDVWLAAWRRAKENRGARIPGGGSLAVEPAPAEVGGGWWLSGPDEDIVHVVHIPITRGHVRAAVVAIALLGLVASSTSAPAVRAAGLAAFGVAAAVTLADQAHTRAVRQLPPAVA